jgi:death-on-curing protein
VRYLTLAEAFLIAEFVTGTPAETLIQVSRTDLLDSALHAPQAGWEETDFYPNFYDKAAVLCSRIARNHPLPDGNKRLAWMCLVVFCDVNNYELEVPTTEAVDTIVLVAAGELDEPALAAWIKTYAQQRDDK